MKYLVVLISAFMTILSLTPRVIVITADASDKVSGHIPLEITKSEAEIRTASWYGEEDSCHYEGCLMANGERFDEDKISCASRTYYGKTLKIEHGGKTIICPVTDKISVNYDADRVDLSRRAFSELADLEKGLITISLTIQ